MKLRQHAAHSMCYDTHDVYVTGPADHTCWCNSCKTACVIGSRIGGESPTDEVGSWNVHGP